jgi:hypothetical protein
MFHHYEDILSRIAEPPRWFDARGVPRYCDFAPDRIADIYTRECALQNPRQEPIGERR